MKRILTAIALLSTVTLGICAEENIVQDKHQAGTLAEDEMTYPNQLQGVYVNTTMKARTCGVLMNSGGLGFYSASTSKTLKANSAYMVLEALGTLNMESLDWEPGTGVDVIRDNREEACYDLQGRRIVNLHNYHGAYIQGHRKLMKK